MNEGEKFKTLVSTTHKIGIKLVSTTHKIGKKLHLPCEHNSQVYLIWGRLPCEHRHDYIYIYTMGCMLYL